MKKQILFVLACLLLLIPMSITQGQQLPQSHQFEAAVLQVVETLEIPATAQGPLIKLRVKTGDMIESGQELATIEDTDVQIRLRESQIELEMMTAQVESEVDINFALKSQAVAMADYRRAQESNQRYAGVVSDREMDRLKLLVEQSTAELEKIRFEKSIKKMQQALKAAAVEKIKNELQRHQVQSGISGQIVEVFKRSGEWVNIADPVMKVVRLDRLRVEHYLPAKFATSDLLGSESTFASKIQSEEISGKVVFVNPEVNPLNSTVQVWIEFDNPGLKLRPGLKGTVNIVKSDKTEKKTASHGQ